MIEEAAMIYALRRILPNDMPEPEVALHHGGTAVDDDENERLGAAPGRDHARALRQAIEPGNRGDGREVGCLRDLEGAKAGLGETAGAAIHKRPQVRQKILTGRGAPEMSRVWETVSISLDREPDLLVMPE